MKFKDFFSLETNVKEDMMGNLLPPSLLKRLDGQQIKLTTRSGYFTIFYIALFYYRRSIRSKNGHDHRVFLKCNIYTETK